ncbi:MAG: DUF2950 family protein [Phycisphaeraceae bacterium]|nr:DUF2950 family protein [Phycisphaeraceae bacterium]
MQPPFCCLSRVSHRSAASRSAASIRPKPRSQRSTRATETRDKSELRRIFGPRTAELRSEDENQDKLDFASFQRALAEGREIETVSEDQAILLMGEVRWPFAVPLVRRSDSKWLFDTDAGIEELENRRIGRNELRTIAACRTLVDAQRVYRSVDRNGDGISEYAQRLMSTPGAKDGLYWPSYGGVDPSPIGPVFAQAAVRTDDAGNRVPFNGYRFRLLNRQGQHAQGGTMEYVVDGRMLNGWAVVAWPDVWDGTGVMTFIVSHAGVVYEADLGPETESAAADINAFDPDPTLWKAVTP